jgi:hypothetical protein
MSNITIRGSGFNDISEVWIGQGKCNTWSVNPNYNEIYAQVPIDATSGRVRLISSRRQKTGVSTQSSGFWAIPKLTKYLNTTFDIIPGAYIHLDGYHMNGITGATVNNLTLTANPSIVNNNRILIVAPSGNCRGLFRVWSTGNIRVASNFSYDPNIPITGINKTGFLTGDFILVTGRTWVPELMFSAGGNNYYGRIGDNGERMQFTRIDHQTLSGTVTTGAQNGTVYIEREDGYSYANQNIKVEIYRSPVVTGFLKSPLYYPEYNTVNGSNLNRITGIKYRAQVSAVDYEWTPWSGQWVINHSATQLIFPSTGFSKALNEAISGSYAPDYISMAFLYPEGSGLLEYNAAPALRKSFQYLRWRETGPMMAFTLFFTGNHNGINGSFFTGSGLVQRVSYGTISAPYGYWSEYRLSGISGFNWYATGTTATGLKVNDENGYGLNRTFRVNAGSNKTLLFGSTGWPLVGSGLLRSTQYSGMATGFYYFPYTYVCEDGFVSGMSGFLAIRP